MPANRPQADPRAIANLCRFFMGLREAHSRFRSGRIARVIRDRRRRTRSFGSLACSLLIVISPGGELRRSAHFPTTEVESLMKRIQHAIGFAVAAVMSLTAGLECRRRPAVDFFKATMGAEPKSFISVVGHGGGLRRTATTRCWSVDGRHWKEASSGSRHRGQGTRSAVWRRYAGSGSLFRPTPISLCRGQDVAVPRRRHIRAVRRHFQPHRSRRGNPLQSEAEWRLPDHSCQPARE